MLFSKRSSASNDSINLAFTHHRSDSGTLLIYNSGKNRLSNLVLILYNSDKKEYRYERELISTRSNEMIEFTIQPDIKGQIFEGELVKVTVETAGQSWNFKATAEGKFVKV
jgi:hypothetical protein